MTKPAQLQGLRLLPPVEVLLERLHAVEADLADLKTKQAQGLTGREAAGTSAHIAALSRRRQWYLSRIRSVRPVESLGVSVSEEIKSKEAHP